MLHWYGSFAVPGLGMFCEAYIIFSVGNIADFQKVLYPTCFDTFENCPRKVVEQKIDSYIQIAGIMVGMMLMGVLGDYLGRKWGSRVASVVMLSGVLLLVFTPFTASPSGYFTYFIIAQTWYGVGVGGEYPMASSSAAERAEAKDRPRGKEVVMVFSNQGMGNLINCLVLLVAMNIFGQTGHTLDKSGSRAVLALMYAVGASVCLATVCYLFMHLEESEIFQKHMDESKSRLQGGMAPWLFSRPSLLLYWPRQFVASIGWIANDFAFYGNKLQQHRFIELLYPTATPMEKLEWTALNSFIALLGYYAAATLMDSPWYGRRTCQIVGFVALFVFYITIYLSWGDMNADSNLPVGMRWFQALYYLSSFFNQFGPNCTTWLVAGEIFPTQIRTTNHGIASTMGKLGAIVATIWIINIGDREVFLVSSMWAVGGVLVTWLFLPDTTGMNLKDLDVLHKHIVSGTVSDYTGDALNSKHLSVFERLAGMGDHAKRAGGDGSYETAAVGYEMKSTVSVADY